MAQAHKFRKGYSLYSTTLSAGISTGTGETITPNSVSGLPTDTEITLTIDRVDSSGNATPTKMERITGVISAGNLTSYTRGIDGTTEQAHSSGAVVEYIWNADDLNDLVDGILVGHNQDGTHDPAIIYDTNANEELKFTATASAINEFTMTNAAANNDPILSVTGGDTNIDMQIRPKASGVVSIGGVVSTAYTNSIFQTGTASATPSGSETNKDGTVTFTRAFSDTPVVVGCMNTKALIPMAGVQISGVSSSGFTFTIISTNGTTNLQNGAYTISWIAMGAI